MLETTVVVLFVGVLSCVLWCCPSLVLLTFFLTFLRHVRVSCPSLFLFRCVAAEIERISLIESGDLDEDEAHSDPVPAITKVGTSFCFVWRLVSS